MQETLDDFDESFFLSFLCETFLSFSRVVCVVLRFLPVFYLAFCRIN